MKTLATTLAIGALWLMALSISRISSDMHEVRWLLVANAQKASW